MPGLIKKLLVAAALLAGLSLFSPVPPVSANPKGSETKGRYYFRQNCKQCHTKGAVGGEITPLNKTQAQWKAYFATGKHSKGKEPLAKVMTPDELRDVSAFLDAHASDSLQPETCGK